MACSYWMSIGGRHAALKMVFPAKAQRRKGDANLRPTAAGGQNFAPLRLCGEKLYRGSPRFKIGMLMHGKSPVSNESVKVFTHFLILANCKFLTDFCLCTKVLTVNDR